MNGDFDDLEPIDVTAPTVTASASGPGASSWPPGWYADPWTAGQYRYWTGQTWSGETNRWGPATSALPPGVPTDPWPSPTLPVSSGYGEPPRAASDIAPMLGAPSRHRGPMIAGALALAVVLLVSGVVGYAINSRSHPKRAAVLVPTPTTPRTPTTNGAPSTDPDRRVLTSLVVRQADVGTARTVALIPRGNQLGEPTLDLCNGKYASEALRTARLQVVVVDARDTASLGTEAVLYRSPADSVQAFAELRKVSASCPRGPVASPVGEATAATVFYAPPDGKWPHTPTVERQAYSIVTTEGADTSSSIAVYLRRGRALLGLYFPQPKGAQPPVSARRSIEGIVGVFEARMAKLPPSVVNANG